MARNSTIRQVDGKVATEHPDDEAYHFCYDGWVFLGYESVDEDGEHLEVIERVPCRRCHPESH